MRGITGADDGRGVPLTGPMLVDAGIAAFVVAVGVAEIATGQIGGPLWASLVSAFGFGLPLLRRRQNPWAALVAVYLTMVFCVVAGVGTEDYLASVISGVLVVATLAVETTFWPSVVGLVAAFAVLVLTVLGGIGGDLWGGFIVGAAWVAGRLIRSRRLLIDELRATTAELERSREQHAARAVDDERARIARELHDVVAHAVSVMVVQAGAAQRVLDLDRDRAVAALDAVQDTGREALDELRRMLGVLRPGTAGGTSPQPGLGDLSALTGSVQRAGVAVTVERSGVVRTLPAGVELTAYRILQEALTNVLKHARATSASVELDYLDDVLDLSVTNDGAPGDPVVPGAGQGLVGMRERVALYGGRLDAGPGDAGGFVVRASLPLGAS